MKTLPTLAYGIKVSKIMHPPNPLVFLLALVNTHACSCCYHMIPSRLPGSGLRWHFFCVVEAHMLICVIQCVGSAWDFQHVTVSDFLKFLWLLECELGPLGVAFQQALCEDGETLNDDSMLKLFNGPRQHWAAILVLTKVSFYWALSSHFPWYCMYCTSVWKPRYWCKSNFWLNNHESL